jgi:hypothetical protein
LAYLEKGDAMRKLIVFALILFTGCAGLPASPNPTQPLPRADLPDEGEAPELTNETWLNTDAPLRLADLRGKVVLLDMWTFG